MHDRKAKEIFDEAKTHINPKTDPVMWDLINGLSELCDSVRQLHNEIADLKRNLP